MIELRQVSKSFGATKVLNSISLQLLPEQIHALLGVKGSGKTTLVRLLLGLEATDFGEIIADGVPIVPKNQTEIATHFGYLSTHGDLFPHLTALENISLAARLRGWTEVQREVRLGKLAQLIQLENAVLERFPDELTDTQRVRVCLLRALMLDPPILVLDDPLSDLDTFSRAIFRLELAEVLKHLKKTVLFASDSLLDLASAAHTLTILRNGKIAQQGELAQILSAPSSAVQPYLKAFELPAALQGGR